jgi:hypothetical protein
MLSLKDAIQKKIVGINPNFVRKTFGKLLEWGGHIISFLGARVFNYFDTVKRTGRPLADHLKKSEQAIDRLLSGAVLHDWIKFPEQWNIKKSSREVRPSSQRMAMMPT